MKKIFFVTCLIMLTAIGTQAQDIENTYCPKKFEVKTNKTSNSSNKGFCRTGDIDYEAIVREFGIPDEFPTLEQSRAIPFGCDQRLVTAVYFKDGKRDWLGFANNEFDCFHLTSNRFTVLKGVINGGIRVGENVSKIRQGLPRTKGPANNFNDWDFNKHNYVYNELFNADKPNEKTFIIYSGGKDQNGNNVVSDDAYIIESENDIVTEIHFDCTED